MTTIINLWGGAGCGKSTLAALLYAHMKMQGRGVELVREYVKTWAWEGRPIRSEDELYIFTKQLRAEAHLYGKVEWIVTDRPLGLSVVYQRFFKGNGAIETIWQGIMHEQSEKGIKHLNLMVARNHPYQSAGRNQTEEESKAVDKICREVMPGMPLVSTPEQILSILDGDNVWVCTACGKDLDGPGMTLGGGGPFCVPCGARIDAVLQSDGQLIFSDS